MGAHFPSGLLAGVTAAVIWMAVTLMVGYDGFMVGLWGLIFLVGVTVVTMIIANAVARSKSGGVQRA